MAKKNDAYSNCAKILTIMIGAILIFLQDFINFIINMITLIGRFLNYLLKPKSNKVKKTVKYKPKHSALTNATALSTLLNDDELEDEELEREMSSLNLEDWQKDLVREGKYSPYDFEEEELEEDDFYYEDD